MQTSQKATDERPKSQIGWPSDQARILLIKPDSVSCTRWSNENCASLLFLAQSPDTMQRRSSRKRRMPWLPNRPWTEENPVTHFHPLRTPSTALASTGGRRPLPIMQPTLSHGPSFVIRRIARPRQIASDCSKNGATSASFAAAPLFLPLTGIV